jgi:hypothetical protein
MYGGIIACGTTHTAMTPLDVVKCNMQANPSKYKTVWKGARTILREEGVLRGLFKGWEPTFAGYSLQGAGKFGLYEVFKDAYSNVVGEDWSYRFRDAIYVVAAGSAEFLADIALCPMEMIKVKVQTSPMGTFPVAFGEAAKEMIVRSPETGFPLGSLVPLWGRQIPYTVRIIIRIISSTFDMMLVLYMAHSYSHIRIVSIVFLLKIYCFHIYSRLRNFTFLKSLSNSFTHTSLPSPRTVIANRRS